MQPHRIPRPGRFASSFRRRVGRRVSVPTESDRPYVVPPVVLPAAEQAEVAVSGALGHAGSSPISLAEKGVTPAPNPAQRPGHRCRLSSGIARLTRHTENHVGLTSLTIGPSRQQRRRRLCSLARKLCRMCGGPTGELGAKHDDRNTAARVQTPRSGAHPDIRHLQVPNEILNVAVPRRALAWPMVGKVARGVGRGAPVGDVGGARSRWGRSGSSLTLRLGLTGPLVRCALMRPCSIAPVRELGPWWGNRGGRVGAQGGVLGAQHGDLELLRASTHQGQAYVRIFGMDWPSSIRHGLAKFNEVVASFMVGG